MRLIPTVLATLVVACQAGIPVTPTAVPAREPASPTSDNAAPPATAGETAAVELRFDETVSQGELLLRLLELNDSRCPLGVQCVWEGQVAATVEVSRDEFAPRVVELVLRSGLDAGAKAVAGHQLRLLNVEPYPREGVTPERREYFATLEIEPS